MKIALYHRPLADADQAAFQQLLDTLRRHRVSVVDLDSSLAEADFLFSVGGDGTLLGAVQYLIRNPQFSLSDSPFPPVVGINFGHLGFLTTAGRDGIGQLVDDLIHARYSVEHRTLLQAAGLGAVPAYALNEVFLHRSEQHSLLRTQVYVDGNYVATYAGDGVICATPTGSTAYSLSCGGPILTPDSGCFVITPIGAHTLTLRPIIVPDSANIRLLTDRSHASIQLGVDSMFTTAPGGTDLSLSRAPFALRLIRLNSQNFFSAIRDKLMWGTEVRH